MKKYYIVFKRLLFSKTAKSTYITTIGAGLNAFVSFIFTIIIARSISPANFGLYSVVLNIVSILTVVCDAGLSTSVLKFLPKAIRENDTKECNKILKVSLIFTLLFSALTTLLLVVITTPLVNNILKKPELLIPLLIVSVGLIGLSLSGLSSTILQAKQKFLFSILTDLSVVISKTILVVILLIFGLLNLNSVLVIIAMSSFVGLLLAHTFIKTDYLKTALDYNLAKYLLKFAGWIIIARIANSVSSRIDTLMLVRYVENAEIGYYAAAQRMTFIMTMLIGGVTTVITPKFSSLRNNKEVKAFIKKTSLLVCLLFFPLIILFMLAPWLVINIYGHDYLPSVQIFRWLLVSTAFSIIAAIPISVLIYFHGHTRTFAFLSIIQLILITGFNLVLIPHYGVIGPAISLAIAYGAVALTSSVIIIKHVNEKKTNRLG